MPDSSLRERPRTQPSHRQCIARATTRALGTYFWEQLERGRSAPRHGVYLSIRRRLRGAAAAIGSADCNFSRRRLFRCCRIVSSSFFYLLPPGLSVFILRVPQPTPDSRPSRFDVLIDKLGRWELGKLSSRLLGWSDGVPTRRGA